ncbi:MAG: hypothetical protein JWQ69_4542, partial [Pseudomonas sp.]|nr:hypothetical protein [Pseudomonas sp.]
RHCRSALARDGVVSDTESPSAFIAGKRAPTLVVRVRIHSRKRKIEPLLHPTASIHITHLLQEAVCETSVWPANAPQ